MGCIGCSVKTNGSEPAGCGSKGGCSTGGCNRLNTYDWLSSMDLADTDNYNLVEVSFKNGARKNFFRLKEYVQVVTGDMVVVESGNGFDMGKVSLSGELVRLQMKKKKVLDESIAHNIIRRANDRDLDRLHEARQLEMSTMIRARAIARTLDLDMKIGDVEYQGDKRKATFYYTADGRVDFRELIRHFAKEFRVKIEMRQIGARQESARIGGLGSCGRELCCSTWLTDFKSVSTAAARYQNLAINQAKLSGQCGRLKCCLNYELDTYVDALEAFPKDVDRLETDNGTGQLIKTDIFQGIMYYAYQHENGRGKIFALDLDRVKAIKALNMQGKKPSDLIDLQTLIAEAEEIDLDYAAVNDIIDLPMEEKRHKKRRKKRRKPNKGGGNNRPNNKQQQSKTSNTNRNKPESSDNNRAKKQDDNAQKNDPTKQGNNRKGRNRRGRGRNPNQKK